MMEKLKTMDLGDDTNTMMTPDSLYTILAESLQLEISLCKTLFDVVERKLDGIVKVDAEVIIETAREEESLASQLSDVTSRRTAATTDLCHLLHAPPLSRLGELLEFMDPQNRERIKPLREELIKIGTKVKQTNDMNKKILEGSQKRIEDYFKLACQTEDGAKTYTATGENKNRRISFFSAEA